MARGGEPFLIYPIMQPAGWQAMLLGESWQSQSAGAVSMDPGGDFIAGVVAVIASVSFHARTLPDAAPR